MSDVENRILTKETGSYIADGINAIARALGGKNKLTFQQIQRYVRSGVIDRYLAIGDEIEVDKETGLAWSVSHAEGSTSTLTVTAVDEATWNTHVEHLHHGVYEFKYDGYEWSENEFGSGISLSYYGITTSGTPAEGDIILITVSATTLVFQYVAKDKAVLKDPSLTHSAIFQLKNCYMSLLFEPSQALIYANEAMPAGTYHFKLYKPSNIYYLNAGLQNKDVQFTTTVDIPKGGQLLIASSNLNTITTVAGITLRSLAYPGADTDLENPIACVEGTDGTDLGDANKVANSSKINSTDRTVYGSCNWQDSFMRMWLNADTADWWQPGSIYSKKPSASSNKGWMYGIEKDFLDVLQEVKVTTTKNWFDGSGNFTTYDKFFLPSLSQVYMQASGTEGSNWDYYKLFSSLSAAGTGSDPNRIKLLNGSPTYWWLRTPVSSYSNYEYNVNTTGAYSSSGANNPYGVAPACCIA